MELMKPGARFLTLTHQFTHPAFELLEKKARVSGREVWVRGGFVDFETVQSKNSR